MSKSKQTSPKSGKCKLTGIDGRYVEAHIIPKALTETVWKGKPLTQRGEHGRYIKRWTSWYDPALVIQAGEDILTDYDTWAIEFFRQRRLIWSSWGPMTSLSTSDLINGPNGIGARQLKDLDARRLRLFFLSLLWRAAATTLFEFKNVTLRQDQLEQLREVVKTGTPEPFEFFPVALIQLSSKNFPHNQSPIRAKKRSRKLTKAVV
jgi:hypothetical protein